MLALHLYAFSQPSASSHKLYSPWCLGYSTVFWAELSDIRIPSKLKPVCTLTLHKVYIQICKISHLCISADQGWRTWSILHLYIFTSLNSTVIASFRGNTGAFYIVDFTQLMDRKGEVRPLLQFWWDHCVVEVCLISILISMMLKETKTAQCLFKTSPVKDLPLSNPLHCFYSEPRIILPNIL